MQQKKYIIILSILLISILLTGKIRAEKAYEFTEIYSYTFDNKKNSIVLKDCRESYDSFMFDEQDYKDKIIEAINVFQLSDYLLYRGNISSAVYYDIMKTILLLDEIKTLDKKDVYINELNTYMTRKKKTGLSIISYEVSKPIINKSSNKAYVIVINKYANGYEESIKYNFQKENGKWYYIDKHMVRVNSKKDENDG